jgi:hypothetical protein
MGKRRAKLKACDPFNPNRKKKVEDPRKNMPVDDDKKDRLSLSQKRLMQSQRQLVRVEQRKKEKKKNRRQQKLLSADNGRSPKPNKNNQNKNTNPPKTNNSNTNANNNNSKQKKNDRFEFEEVGSQTDTNQKNNNNNNNTTKEMEIDPAELEMKPWENFYQFRARLNSITREVLKEKDRGISETLKQKNKKQAHSEMKKQKELEKKEKKIESRVDEFDRFKDHIQFGEVVDQPPEFSKSSHAAKFVVLADKKKKQREVLGKGEPIEKRRQLEMMRDRVVQAYEAAKKRRREEQADIQTGHKAKKPRVDLSKM